MLQLHGLLPNDTHSMAPCKLARAACCRARLRCLSACIMIDHGLEDVIVGSFKAMHMKQQGHLQSRLYLMVAARRLPVGPGSRGSGSGSCFPLEARQRHLPSSCCCLLRVHCFCGLALVPEGCCRQDAWPIGEAMSAWPTCISGAGSIRALF